MLVWNLWDRYSEMTILLVLAVVVGLVLPDLATIMRPLLYPSLFCIMVLTLVQINFASIGQTFASHGYKIVAIIAAQMLVLPIIAIGLIRIIGISDGYAVPMVLVTCAGSMFGTPAIALLLKLEGRVALFGVLVSTLIIPVSLPVAWLMFAGESLPFDMRGYLLRLFIYIALPGLLAWMFHRLSNGYRSVAFTRFLGLASVAALSVFAIAIMDGVTRRFYIEPEFVIGLTFLAMALHFGLFGLIRLSGRWLGRAPGLELGLLSGFRNIGLIIAISGPMLPADFFLFAGIWQIPMYLSPWIFSVLIRKAIL